ncbi:MAG: hypothetical protein AAGD13_13210 [Pseudomonadota bacterium]
MRQLLVTTLLLGFLLPSLASGSTVFVAYDSAEPPFERDMSACPESAVDGVYGFVGERRVCADGLTTDLRAIEAVVDGQTDEIVLLTSRPAEKTVYRATERREPILSLVNIIRGRPLIIRGQSDAEGQPLVWLEGLDLTDTVCDPERVHDLAACRAGRPSESDAPVTKNLDRRYELTSLALIEHAAVTRAIRTADTSLAAVSTKGPRSYCIRMRQVASISIEDLGFQDCWIAAIALINARDVSVRRARIHGSTFGVLALATGGMELGAHTYRVEDSVWLQSPSAYRPDAEPCRDPHLNLECAVDVWHDVPWGVTHHHLWRVLNGALFGSYNIAGNVLISGNLIERAYNGVRMISDLPGTGRNVEIRDNRFRFVRDNAVEPETHADGWVIKNNVFDHVHAWIASDGVRGGSMYVFGNVGFYDAENLSGQTCRDDVDWSISPRFHGMASDDGHYRLVDIAYDPTSVTCDGHRRGVVLKGGDKRKSEFPYMDWISIFNNSWRTRSPLFSGKHAAPLSHFNNAVAFTGCGLDGPDACRQVPAPEQYCRAGNKRTRGRVALSQFWTADDAALVADCFTFTPGPAEPDDRVDDLRAVSHRFCRDVFDREIDSLPYPHGSCDRSVVAGLFADGKGLDAPQQIAGCTPVVSDGRVEPNCERGGTLVGAVQEDGSLFDMEIRGAGFLGDAFMP